MYMGGIRHYVHGHWPQRSGFAKHCATLKNSLMINCGTGTLIAPNYCFSHIGMICNVLEMVEPNKRPLWPIITKTNRYNVTYSL